MPTLPQQIRNVAIVGARGSGKTTLHEALLYEAGAIGRRGTVGEGNTYSDREEEERARGLSLATAVATFQYRDHLINLLDTPGEPSFLADALAAIAVCESAILVVNAAAGVEVHTHRLWEALRRQGVATLAYVNMLDKPQTDFLAVLEELKGAFGPHVVATELPLGVGPDLAGVIDLIDLKAYRQEGVERASAAVGPVPDDLLPLAERQRERLLDEVAELSEQLMERYLEGEQLDHQEVVAALEGGTAQGRLFPCLCGSAERNLASGRLLEAIVEDLPSPLERDRYRPEERTRAYIFKTRADPYAGRVSLVRVFSGALERESQLHNPQAQTRERIGQLVRFGAGEVEHVGALAAGEIGAVLKLKESKGGDWLVAGEGEAPAPLLDGLPQPAMAFACAPKSRGDEEKMLAALRRLQEEDPTIDLHRDAQTGEQIVAGLSQLQVEVLLERLRRRFGVAVELTTPKVPYRETIRHSAPGHGRHKKQTGGRGQFADCRIEVEPLGSETELEFIDEIKGGVIPSQFIPAVEKGVREAMASGVLAGYPVTGLRVRLVDGAHHPVDSSDLAFKVAGSLALKEALAAADPVLLEPVMLVTVTVPAECVGDVLGDLNGRRGRPQGMEPRGPLTELKAEAPLAELLTYGNELRGLTGGRGEYSLEFRRYEPVPAPLAERVVAARRPAGAPAVA